MSVIDIATRVKGCGPDATITLGPADLEELRGFVPAGNKIKLPADGPGGAIVNCNQLCEIVFGGSPSPKEKK